MAEFVKDVMTPGVVAVRPDASVVEAARLMRGQNIGDVVVADGQRVVGWSPTGTSPCGRWPRAGTRTR